MAVVTPARLGKLRLNAGRLAYVAPITPHTPNPPHQSIAGPLAVSWLGTPATNDVYFGTTTTPPLIGSTPSLGWVLPPLTVGVTYYWRVVATNPLGTASGPLWSFTAAVPVAPTYVSPPHHSTNQPTAITLVWTHPLVVPGDIVFDVYFGPTPSAPLVSARQSARTYTPSLLHDGVDYYWRIVAINAAGSASGPTWTFETRNPTKGLITIGGVDVRGRVRVNDFRIRDLLNVPNTAQLTVDGSAPTLAQEVRIGLATLAGDDVLFGGYIDTVEAVYEGLPVNRAWRVTAQDYVYGINRRKVRRRYIQQSATLIAQDLLTRDAPAGYTGTQIQAGLPIVSGGIDFTEEDLAVCFARLAQRIGGYWYVDYAKDVHLFLTEASDAPTPITAAARVLLDDPPITWEADLTQVRTRVFVEGGGSQARALTAVGATSLPVTDASWYSPTGGLVVTGPQRISYSGKGTVGGPAKPTTVGQSVPGNLGGGPYSYVVTQVTGGAEGPLSAPSTPVTLAAVASPPQTMTVTPVSGAVPAPTSAPTVVPVDTRVSSPTTAPTVAPVNTQVVDPTTAPTVTATSLRVPLPTAPVVTPISTQVAPPTSAMSAAGALPRTGEITVAHLSPTVTMVDQGTGGIIIGQGQLGSWAFTATNARGETTRSSEAQMFGAAVPFNARVVVPNHGDPTITSTKIYRSITGIYQYVGTISGSAGGVFIDSVPAASAGAAAPSSNTTGTPGAGSVAPGLYTWIVRYGTSQGETDKGPTTTFTLPAASTPPHYTAVQLTGIPTSPDGRVTKRSIWRTKVNEGGGAVNYLVATINDNTTTTYLDTKSDAQLGASGGSSPPNTTGTGGLVPGGYYAWAVTFGSSSTETVIGPWADAAMPAGADTVSVTGIPTSADGRVTRRKLYRTKAGGGAFYLVATISDNTTTTYTDAKTDAALGAVSPATDTTGGSLTPGAQYGWLVTYGTSSGETTYGSSFTGWLTITGDAAQLSAIPISPDTRVNKRRVYRNGNGWQLEATINDNTTTTYVSSMPAGSLGAAAPSANTTHGSGSLVMGGYYGWAVTFVTASGETAQGPYWGQGLPPYDNTAQLSAIPTSPDGRVVARRIYRTKHGGGTFYLEATINDNATTTYTSTKSDGSLGAASPGSNTTGSGGLVPGWQYGWVVTFGSASGETTVGPSTNYHVMPGDMAELSNIPTSADGRVTKRLLYRVSYEAGSVWRLEATINDNTTTTYLSTKSEGQLGTAGLPPVNTTGTGGLTPGAYSWTVKYVTATGESGEMPYVSAPLAAGYDLAQLAVIPTSADARVTKRRLYRTLVNGSTFRFEFEIADNTTTTYTSTKRDDQLGADMVSGNTTSAGGQIAVSAIAVGVGGTTARKLYRTESGGAAYKLVVILNDNTTLTYQDNKADGSLGALAPVDLVTELIGIPASGTGSVLYEIRLGDDVNVLAQCDDVPAQTALAALEGGGSTGIVEHFLQDRRLSLSTATATGNADLALFARPLVTVRYATRDPKTRAGKTVSITLPELSLTGVFTIQTVEIDQIDLAPGLLPRFTVTASSIRFSLEDVLRRLQLAP